MSQKNRKQMFGDSLIAGIGWAFGVTIGFVLVSTTLVVVLRFLGGTPLIGKWIAGIVEATQAQLTSRTPFVN